MLEDLLNLRQIEMEHNKKIIKQNPKLISFNCSGVKRCIDGVRELCQTADILALQETWLWPHDILFLGSIHEDFGYTGKSGVDTSRGIVRGRPYGGVAILWRKKLFRSVSVVECMSVRITGIKVVLEDRRLLVFSIYMPTGRENNLAEFTDCLSEVRAVMDDCDVDSVFILGDFNAHPSELFGRELQNFCAEQKWICADINILGLTSGTYTYVSDAYGTVSWLDHIVATEVAMTTI